MSLMFRNTNAALEQELAAEDYKAHPVRNRLAILAVALTAVLMVVTFTVGVGLVRTTVLSLGASPGPGADSSVVYGDEQILGKIRQLSQVDWAAYVKRCSSTRLHNKEFAGLDVFLYAADEVHYDKNMIDLLSGKYPENAEEILLSDTMSKRLGLDEEIGAGYTLKVVIQRGDEEVEQEIPMTVCGYYRNPLKNCAEVYEEIYTSKAFIGTYNPDIPAGHDTIYVKLNNLNPLKFKHDVAMKLYEVNEAVGGNGIGFKNSDVTVITVIPMLLIVLCIMFCGYFFIYNIFDISVVNNIRFYGELKTIGMTSKQLKRMLFWQMNRIAFWGIATGGMFGCITGQVASGKLLETFADNIAMYYKPAGIAETLLLGAIFSWVTILISTMKPFRIASTVSPVEAARYRSRRKKGVFSIVSFALSGILFLVVYTISVGFSVEVQIERHNNSEFQLRHKGIMWVQNEPYVPIGKELTEKLQDLEFVEDFKTYYVARTKPDYYDNGGVNIYETSAEITRGGEVAKDRIAYLESLYPDELVEEAVNYNERGNLPTRVAGLDAECLTDEMEYFEVLEGSIDAEKFADGDSMVYLRDGIGDNMGLGEEMEYRIHAGDQVSVTFYDDVAKRYVDKKLTVMAVVTGQDVYGVSNMYYSNIWLEKDTFRSIYSDYENLVGAIRFNGANQTKDGRALSEQEKQEMVEQVLKEDGNLQLMLNSVYQDRVYFTQMQRTVTVFGMFLVVIVGLIGIANMVNTVTTDVMARKVEYAAMQSIGMTGKQMQQDIFRKYALYTFTSQGIAIVAGAVICYLVGQDVVFNTSLSAFVQAVGIFLLFSVALCVMTARTLTRVMNQKSVVERLRDV